MIGPNLQSKIRVPSPHVDNFLLLNFSIQNNNIQTDCYECHKMLKKISSEEKFMLSQKNSDERPKSLNPTSHGEGGIYELLQMNTILYCRLV